MLVDEQHISTETLAKCREAIEVRNNVVHLGQRDIPAKELLGYLVAIERCCGAFRELTDSSKEET
jgi:hypothetical protein